MLPFEVQHISSGPSETTSVFHADTIHHVEFDFYGQRVATVSSDKTIYIWDKDPQSAGGWRKSASWKKHGGAVWKVRFAHPEYGQVLATCSFDNTIQIFDKDAADLMDTRADSGNGWVCRAVLRQSQASASITDIQFAPHYLGLQLAACTSSGRLIIYEAEDIMALDNWNALQDFEVAPHRLSSLSWSTNRFDPPYIAVSSDDIDAPPGEKVFLFRVNVNTGFVRVDLRGPSSAKQQQPFLHFDDQISAVSFGPSSGLAQHRLAVAVGAKIHIYQLVSGAAITEDENDGNGGGEGLLTENGRTQQEAQGTSEFLLVKGCEVLEEGNSQVVRLSWNIVGDVISGVYADGLIRVWRYAFSNRWLPVSTITPPAEQDRNTRDDVYY